MLRRLGASEESILVVQGNLACTYASNRRFEEALQIERDVYSGRMKLNGEAYKNTLLAANNYALSLCKQKAYEEAKLLMQKCLPAARRLLGESDEITLRNRLYYAKTLHEDDGATLEDLREAVTTLEETARTARHVLGGAHPVAKLLEGQLLSAREILSARSASLSK